MGVKCKASGETIFPPFFPFSERMHTCLPIQTGPFEPGETSHACFFPFSEKGYLPFTCISGEGRACSAGSMPRQKPFPPLPQPWQVPASRAFTPEEWEAEHAGEAGTPAPEPPAAAADALGFRVSADGAPAVKEEPKPEARPGRGDRRPLTLKERLEVCQATERQRLAFCKVRTEP